MLSVILIVGVFVSMDRGEQRKKRKDKFKEKKRHPYKRGGKFRSWKSEKSKL